VIEIPLEDLPGASGERRKPGIEDAERITKTHETPTLGQRTVLRELHGVTVALAVEAQILRTLADQLVLVEARARGKRVLPAVHADEQLGPAEGKPERGSFRR
jgi:hypothetical protein